jgi:hypothetical protein
MMTACGRNRSCNTAFVKMLLITTVVWRLLCQHNFMTQQDVHLQDSIWALVLYIQLRDTWYSKTYTHWVLLMLTVTSNSIRHYCWSICSTTSTESDAFMQKIVSGNDVWCHHFQTQKKNCMQWEQPFFPALKNSIPNYLQGKLHWFFDINATVVVGAVAVVDLEVYQLLRLSAPIYYLVTHCHSVVNYPCKCHKSCEMPLAHMKVKNRIKISGSSPNVSLMVLGT